MCLTQKVRARSTSGNLVHNINLAGEGKEKLGATGVVSEYVKAIHKQRESQLADSTRSSHDDEVAKAEEEGDERKFDVNSHVGVELFGGRA